MRKILLLSLILSFLLLACGRSEASPTAAADTHAHEALPTVPASYAGKTNPLGPEAASAGAELYNTYCSSCHGPKGLGDGPAASALNPRPHNLQELREQVGDDYLFWRISEGVEGTAMVAWKGVLSEEQIWQVIVFIHTLK
ncbi:MAG: c-type cytochrome [Anaerolineales bacterium]